MPLTATVNQPTPEIAFVVLDGSLTLGTNLKVADAQLQTLIEGGVRKLVLDLSKVLYIDSAGLGSIVHTYGLLQERQGVLRLCGVSDRVATMLKMTRADTFIPIDPDQAASSAAL